MSNVKSKSSLTNRNSLFVGLRSTDVVMFVLLALGSILLYQCLFDMYISVKHAEDLIELTSHGKFFQFYDFVMQKAVLFSGTVRDNIRWGKPNSTDDEINDALKLAQVYDNIYDKDGLDTVIEQNGANLSGGQKQRVAIARVFLKNPPILILDEATSALDTETEMIIQQSLAELAENRTTLVIAHRLATIRNADRVLVVTPNGIEEDGQYEELVESNGIFAKLHNIQFRK